MRLIRAFQFIVDRAATACGDLVDLFAFDQLRDRISAWRVIEARHDATARNRLA